MHFGIWGLGKFYIFIYIICTRTVLLSCCRTGKGFGGGRSTITDSPGLNAVGARLSSMQ